MIPGACGIDFGTSNTAVAVAAREDSSVDLIPVEDRNPTIPSAVFFPLETQPPLFGRRAVAAYVTGEEGRFMRSFKRVLGTPLMDEWTRVGDRKIRFAELISHFLGHIKTKAESTVGRELENVVVGRPVHFVDDDAEGDRRAESQLGAALHAVGFKNVQFQFEPIAAAFAHEARLDNKDYLAAVIDIGGGTSDFTIIRLSGRYREKTDRQDDILSNAGIRIGGNDFDRSLSLRCFMPLLGLGSRWGRKNLDFPSTPFFDLSEWSKIQQTCTPKYKRDVQALAQEAHDSLKVGRLLKVVEDELGHRLMGFIEEAKIKLSSAAQAEADLSFIETGLQAVVGRQPFEESLKRNGERIRNCLRTCLADAGVKPEAIELVILTGGGTSIPALQRLARETFPCAEISEGNRMSSVGLGLAYDARRRYG